VQTLGTIFARIVRDFDRISTNQNFGGALSPPAPPPPTPLPWKIHFWPLPGKIPSGAHVQGYMLIYRNAEGVLGQRKFENPWCNTTIVIIGRKVRFHRTLPFMTKQRGSSAAATSRLPQKFGIIDTSVATSDILT